MLSYHFARLASCLACLLPGSLAEIVGRGLGALAWVVIPKWRKAMARENIMLCLGVDEAEADRIAKSSAVRPDDHGSAEIFGAQAAYGEIRGH